MKQIVLITGGTAGLGQSCARFLIQKEYTVYGTGRSVNSGDVSENINLVQCDVLDIESVKKAVDYVIGKEGKIDILINNAGRGMIGSAEDATIEESKALFDINFHGVQRMCQVVLPHMRNARFGKIINVSSLAGIMGLPYRSYYSASKYALEGWSESIRMEVKQFGIHVSIVSPGDFKSNISASRIISKQSRESVYKNQFSVIEKKIDDHVDEGPDPQLIVKAVYRAVASNKPRLRYIAASPFQKLAVHLHYLLPDSLFEKMMLKQFNM
ncbi:MAG: short-subunit dehydrogenase [Patiriisocius sp.]|jgi:short-subunit dehydrogenase